MPFITKNATRKPTTIITKPFDDISLRLKRRPKTTCVVPRHLVSAVSASADKASASEERARSVGSESWGTAVKASSVNAHDYKIASICDV